MSRGVPKLLDSGDALGIHRSRSNSLGLDHRRSSLVSRNSVKLGQSSWVNGATKADEPVEVTLTNQNLNTTSCYGATEIKLHSCSRPIDVQRSLTFSGTLVIVEFVGLVLPQNLMIVLLTGCFLRQLTFQWVRLKGPIICEGRIIAPALKSIQFIGERTAKSLTKHEGLIISFLLNWVIFRKLTSVSFYTKSSSGSDEAPSGSCVDVCGNKFNSQILATAAEDLTKLCLEHSETLKELKLAVPADNYNFQVAFEDMNSNGGESYGLRNRLFQYMSFPENGELEGLKKLQFEVFEAFAASKAKRNKLLFAVLGLQKSLRILTFAEQAAPDGSDHLDTLFTAIKTCSESISEVTIVIGSGRIESRTELYEKSLSLKPLSECKFLKKLTLMINRSKCITDTDSLPRRLEFLSIIGVLGDGEVRKLFTGLKTNCAEYLLAFQLQNNLFAREGPRVRCTESEYYQNGNMITPDMVLELFQCSQLKRVLLCDPKLPTTKIKTAFSTFFGVKVKEFTNNYGNGVSIYARIANASDFDLLKTSS